MDEQTTTQPVTTTNPLPAVDANMTRIVAAFVGLIVAYCIVGLSLGRFVADFSEMGKQLIYTGLGFIIGLVAPNLAGLIKR